MPSAPGWGCDRAFVYRNWGAWPISAAQWRSLGAGSGHDLGGCQPNLVNFLCVWRESRHAAWCRLGYAPRVGSGARTVASLNRGGNSESHPIHSPSSECRLIGQPGPGRRPGWSGSDPSPPAAAPAPAAAPTPGPVVNTGGNVSGSSPGSGCSERLGIRNAPPTQSPTNAWTTNGDAGWPFGWPGMSPPYAVPTTAPSVGCSR